MAGAGPVSSPLSWACLSLLSMLTATSLATLQLDCILVHIDRLIFDVVI